MREGEAATAAVVAAILAVGLRPAAGTPSADRMQGSAAITALMAIAASTGTISVTTGSTTAPSSGSARTGIYTGGIHRTGLTHTRRRRRMLRRLRSTSRSLKQATARPDRRTTRTSSHVRCRGCTSLRTQDDRDDTQAARDHRRVAARGLRERAE